MRFPITKDEYVEWLVSMPPQKQPCSEGTCPLRAAVQALTGRFVWVTTTAFGFEPLHAWPLPEWARRVVQKADAHRKPWDRQTVADLRKQVAA